MTIYVQITNIVPEIPEKTTCSVELKDNATIQELLDAIEYSIADLSEYYTFSGIFSFNSAFCPFLITPKGVEYGVPFTEARLQDFMYTHRITDNIICVTIGYPLAGGPGFLELVQLWNEIFPYLNQIAVISTLTGISAKDIIIWIRKFFERRNASPHVAMDILSSRKYWNHIELAELLDIPEENAKNLLKAFGYVYDKIRMQYVPGELTDELKDRIRAMEARDI